MSDKNTAQLIKDNLNAPRLAGAVNFGDPDLYCERGHWYLFHAGPFNGFDGKHSLRSIPVIKLPQYLTKEETDLLVKTFEDGAVKRYHAARIVGLAIHRYRSKDHNF